MNPSIYREKDEEIFVAGLQNTAPSNDGSSKVQDLQLLSKYIRRRPSDAYAGLRFYLIIRFCSLQKPKIWRRFFCPAHTNLYDLHDRILCPILGQLRGRRQFSFREMNSPFNNLMSCRENGIGEVFSTKNANVKILVDSSLVHLHGRKVIESRFVLIGDILRREGDVIEYLYDLQNHYRYKIQLERIDKKSKRSSNEIDLISGSGMSVPSDFPGNRGIANFFHHCESEESKETKNGRNALNIVRLYRPLSTTRTDSLFHNPHEFDLRFHRTFLQISLRSCETSEKSLHLSKDDNKGFFFKKNLYSVDWVQTPLRQWKQLLDSQFSDRDLERFGAIGFWKIFWDFCALEKSNVRRCSECQKEGKRKKGGTRKFSGLLFCSKCSFDYLCSHECQKKHWKRIHEKECRILKKRPKYVELQQILEFVIEDIVSFLDRPKDVFSCCCVFRGLWRRLKSLARSNESFKIRCEFSTKFCPSRKLYHITNVHCSLPLSSPNEKSKLVRTTHGKMFRFRGLPILFQSLPNLQKIELVLTLEGYPNYGEAGCNMMLKLTNFEHKNLTDLKIRFLNDSTSRYYHGIDFGKNDEELKKEMEGAKGDLFSLNISKFPKLKKLQVSRTWYMSNPESNFGLLSLLKWERSELNELRFDGWRVSKLDPELLFRKQKMILEKIGFGHVTFPMNRESKLRFCGYPKLEELCLKGESFSRLEEINDLPELQCLLLRNRIDKVEYYYDGDDGELVGWDIPYSVTLSISKIEKFENLKILEISSDSPIKMKMNEKSTLSQFVVSNLPNLQDFKIQNLHSSIRLENTPSLRILTLIRHKKYRRREKKRSDRVMFFLDTKKNGRMDCMRRVYVNGYQIEPNLLIQVRHMKQIESFRYNRDTETMYDLPSDSRFCGYQSDHLRHELSFVGFQNLEVLQVLRDPRIVVKEIVNCPKLNRLEGFPPHREIVMKNLPSLKSMEVGHCWDADHSLRVVEMTKNLEIEILNIQTSFEYLLLKELSPKVKIMSISGARRIDVMGDGAGVRRMNIFGAEFVMIGGLPELKDLWCSEYVDGSSFFLGPKGRRKADVNVFRCPKLERFPDFVKVHKN